MLPFFAKLATELKKRFLPSNFTHGQIDVHNPPESLLSSSPDTATDGDTYIHEENRQPLVFDDEPLDGLLYGDNASNPTPADCFLPIKEHMRAIREAHNTHDQATLLTALADITEDGMVLYRPICDEIIEITNTLIPNVPLPELPYDIVGLTPLLERIWALPDWKNDYKKRRALGDRLYRCYEHQKRYADARNVLNTLIHLSQDRGDNLNEAVYTNNLAFEHLLEEQHQDAMPLFQRAEQLFFNKGETFQGANARANSLTCLFSLRPAHELTEYENELNDLAQSLSKDNDWRARKPYVLLSRIRESQNDLGGAIDYTRRAIAASEGKKLKWIEIDRACLLVLMEKQ